MNAQPALICGSFPSPVARELIGETAAELRQLSRALRPPILDDLGPMAALRSEASAFACRSGIEERVRLGHGTLEIGERPGGGTAVSVRVPATPG